jgi:hypothetical protein
MNEPPETHGQTNPPPNCLGSDWIALVLLRCAQHVEMLRMGNFIDLRQQGNLDLCGQLRH